MSAALPFRRLVHCDWSVVSAKRWRADAIRRDEGWHIDHPRPVGDMAVFVADLFRDGPVLAGFDMPIGLPDTIGRRMGADGFLTLLPQLGRAGRWSQFFGMNGEAATVALERPFFPDRWRPGMTAAALTDALGVGGLDDLRRGCERRRPGRRAATPLFWTVGPAQVGKAAVVGWRDVLQPALAEGAALWPFDGALATLARAGGPVLAETYPGEAYGHAGIAFGPRQSKRRAEDRRIAAAPVLDRCGQHGITLSSAVAQSIADGFAGLGGAGEDAFDALAGLLGMIEVVDGRRSEGLSDPSVLPWEGWILGQTGSTDRPEQGRDGT